jgi:hypothetical protein
MPFDSTLYLDSVYVLESLPSGHRRTGERLHDLVLGPAALRLNHFRTRYWRVPDRATLISRLGEIAAATVLGRAPIIHIEAHGAPEGMQLASGEHVAWTDLRPVLTEINTACRFNSLLVMALCFGGYVSRIVQAIAPSPVWASIGPSKEVWDTDLEVGMMAFYQELLTSLDGLKALRELNGHLPISDWEYRFRPAELLFHVAFEQYIEEYTTPKALLDRENDIVATIVRRSGYDLLAGMRARSGLQTRLLNHLPAYERLRETFLMLDRFPENADRFGMTYDELVQQSQGG